MMADVVVIMFGPALIMSMGQAFVVPRKGPQSPKISLKRALPVYRQSKTNTHARTDTYTYLYTPTHACNTHRFPLGGEPFTAAACRWGNGLNGREHASQQLPAHGLPQRRACESGNRRVWGFGEPTQSPGTDHKPLSIVTNLSVAIY